MTTAIATNGRSTSGEASRGHGRGQRKAWGLAGFIYGARVHSTNKSGEDESIGDSCTRVSGCIGRESGENYAYGDEQNY